MAAWDLAQWLEALAYVVAIVGGAAGGLIFVLRARRESIDTLRKDLARAWTNEGNITSTEPIFMTVELALTDGDLIGTLSSSARNGLLEVNVDVLWGKAIVRVSELRGRHVVSVGTARVRLTGNRNRIQWKLVGKSGAGVLPLRTELWPSTVGVVA